MRITVRYKCYYSYVDVRVYARQNSRRGPRGMCGGHNHRHASDNRQDRLDPEHDGQELCSSSHLGDLAHPCAASRAPIPPEHPSHHACRSAVYFTLIILSSHVTHFLDRDYRHFLDVFLARIASTGPLVKYNSTLRQIVMRRSIYFQLKLFF